MKLKPTPNVLKSLEDIFEEKHIEPEPCLSSNRSIEKRLSPESFFKIIHPICSGKDRPGKLWDEYFLWRNKRFFPDVFLWYNPSMDSLHLKMDCTVGRIGIKSKPAKDVLCSVTEESIVDAFVYSAVSSFENGDFKYVYNLDEFFWESDWGEKPDMVLSLVRDGCSFKQVYKKFKEFDKVRRDADSFMVYPADEAVQFGALLDSWDYRRYMGLQISYFGRSLNDVAYKLMDMIVPSKD